MMAVRTNNDGVEGWDHGLHHRSSGRWEVSFYLLIDHLHQEARLRALIIRLVTEKKLKRIQRAKYRSLQAKIFNFGMISSARGKTRNNFSGPILV